MGRNVSDADAGEDDGEAAIWYWYHARYFTIHRLMEAQTLHSVAKSILLSVAPHIGLFARVARVHILRAVSMAGVACAPDSEDT